MLRLGVTHYENVVNVDGDSWDTLQQVLQWLIGIYRRAVGCMLMTTYFLLRTIGWEADWSQSQILLQSQATGGAGEREDLRKTATLGINLRRCSGVQDQQPGNTEKNAHWEEADIQASSGDCHEYTSSYRAVKVKEEPVNKVNEKTDKRTCYRCGTLGHLADIKTLS